MALVVFTSCNEQQADTKSEGEALMQTSRQWSQVAATGNVDSILSYWSDDAVLVSPENSPDLASINIAV